MIFNGTLCLPEDDGDGISDCGVRIFFFLAASLVSPFVFYASRFVKADCFNVVLCQHQGDNPNEIAPKCFINYKAEGTVFMIPRELHRCKPILVQESSLSSAVVELRFQAFPKFSKISADDVDVYNAEFGQQLDQMRLLQMKYFEGDEENAEREMEDLNSQESCVLHTKKKGFEIISDEIIPIDSVSSDVEAGRATFLKGVSFKPQFARDGLTNPAGAMRVFCPLRQFDHDTQHTYF